MNRMRYTGLQIHNKCGLYLAGSMCNVRIIVKNMREEKNLQMSSIQRVYKNISS